MKPSVTRSSGTTVSGNGARACAAALERLLPSREQGLLLAACLREPDTAARAWDGFAAAVRDPKAYFEADRMGLKGLLPFVEASLTARGIDAGKAFHTYARVALVREELRSRIYDGILAAVLARFGADGIAAVVLKGGALSATVYPQPSARHNHAIDLLIDERQMPEAVAALLKVEFAPMPVESGGAFHRNFRHASGLALGLHSRPLFLPQFAMPLAGIRARLVRDAARGITVLSAEDCLVHVCGHATYARSRWNLRWACDVFYLLERNRALSWRTVIDTAAASRLCLPMWVLLRWLKDTLAAPVPAECLEELRERGQSLDSVAAEGIYAAVLHSTLSRSKAFRAFAESWLAQLGFLRFSAIPSREYMRWRHNVDSGWKLAMCYADRPRRALLRLAGRNVPTGTGVAGRDRTEASVRKGVA